MARCRCAGDICTCGVTAGPGVVVDGSGGFNDPYVVSVDPSALIHFVAGPDVNFTITGSGTAEDPLLVTADIICINCADSATAVVGQVLTWDLSGRYVPKNVGVSPGTIITGAGLAGDGTALTPLHVVHPTYASLKGLLT